MNFMIDIWDHNENSFRECVAVWSVNPNTCVYADMMQKILDNGGEYNAPDGCTYSIHEDAEV